MAGLVEWAEAQGYNHEQALVIDLLDDVFTQAENVGLLDGPTIEGLGRHIGRLMAQYVGIMK